MITELLILVASFGNADTTKVQQVKHPITQHCKQIKEVKKEFKDTIKLLKEMEKRKDRKAGNGTNDQVKLNK